MFFYPVHQKRLAKVWIVLCLCCVFPVFATPLATEIAQAQADYQRGHFEQAIRLMQAALDVDNLKTPQRIEIMIQLASAYQALGLSQQALATLSQADPLANPFFGNTARRTSSFLCR